MSAPVVGGAPDVDHPESLNPYLYGFSNPYLYSDPTGMFTMVEVGISLDIQDVLQVMKTFAVQQVKEAMGERDFGGYVYDPDGDGHALRYSEFIAPLIKAVQEEQAARLALEARVKAMEDAGAGAKSPAR